VVGPVFVTTMVKPTVPPGVVVDALAVFTMVRPGTLTVAEQRPSELPAAQFVPSVEEVTVLDSTLLPASGSWIVTE
jgi:hypothetical protein